MSGGLWRQQRDYGCVSNREVDRLFSFDLDRGPGCRANDRSPIGQTAEPVKDNMTETFILIPGRTSDQGCGISEGKFLEKYQKEINTLQVAPGDMKRLGLKEGDRVRLTAEQGQVVEVAVTPAKQDELPEGILFIAYGDVSSRLMGGDTHGSGMPTSKGMDVQLEVLQ